MGPALIAFLVICGLIGLVVMGNYFWAKHTRLRDEIELKEIEALEQKARDSQLQFAKKEPAVILGEPDHEEMAPTIQEMKAVKADQL